MVQDDHSGRDLVGVSRFVFFVCMERKGGAYDLSLIVCMGGAG